MSSIPFVMPLQVRQLLTNSLIELVTETDTSRLYDEVSQDTSGFNFVEVDDRLFFAVDRIEDGSELWMTDGTQSGTVKVTDRPGPLSSKVHDLIEFDGAAYFVATDDRGSEQLYRTDGNTTQVVFGESTGQRTHRIQHLTQANGRFFFVAPDEDFQERIWESDGTASGTRLFRAEALLQSQPTMLIATQTHLLLTFPDPESFSQQLYSIDLAGRSPMTLLATTDESLKFANEKAGLATFTYSARYPPYGNDRLEVLITDGTAKGTYRVVNHETRNPIVVDRVYGQTKNGVILRVWNGEIREAWYVDRRTGAASAIMFGDWPISYSALALSDDGVLFSSGNDLLRFSNSTKEVSVLYREKDFWFSGVEIDNDRAIVLFGFEETWGRHYGSAIIQYSTDKGATWTRSPSPYNGRHPLVAGFVNGQLLHLSGNDQQPVSLNAISLTTSQEVELFNFGTGTGPNSPQIRPLTTIGDTLYGWDFDLGLVSIDPEDGVQQVVSADDRFGAYGFGGIQLFSGTDKALGMLWTHYYEHLNNSDRLLGYEFWSIDAGTFQFLGELAEGINSGGMTAIAAPNGQFYLLDGGQTPGLWVTDGTPRGTQLVKELPSGDTFGYAQTSMHNFKGEVLFTFRSRSAEKAEIWKTDGTKEGTIRIWDTAEPDWGSQLIASRTTTAWTEVNGSGTNSRLFAVTETSESPVWIRHDMKGRELNWPSIVEHDLPTNEIYFTAYISVSQEPDVKTMAQAVFRINDKLEAEIVVSPYELQFQQVVDLKLADDRILFTTARYDDGTATFSLQSYDITTADVTLLHEGPTIWHGNNGYSLGRSEERLQRISGPNGDRFLYLTKTDPNTGYRRLWKTDGTPEGTYSVLPRFADKLLIPPDAEFVQHEDSIVFNAALPETGYELFRIRTDTQTPVLNDVSINVQNGKSIVTWQETGAAVQYDVWLKDLSNPAAPTIQRRVEKASLELDEELTSTAYRVSVRVITLFGELSRWSKAVDVSVGETPIVYWHAAKTTSAIPSFAWSRPADALYDEIWVTNRDSKTRVLYETHLTSSLFTAESPLGHGHHTVWVRSRLKNGEFSAWSQGVNFDVVGAPIELTSGSGEQTSQHFEILWPAVEHATSYEVRIVAAGQSTSTYRAVNIPNVHHQIATALRANDYKVFVRAYRGNRVLTEWGSGTNLKMLVAPTNVRADRETIAWDSSALPALYTIEIWRRDSGQFINRWGKLTRTQIATRTNLTPGMYDVRLRSSFTDGRTSGWSTPVDLMIPHPAPTITSSAEPTADATPFITWTPAASGNSPVAYEIQVTEAGHTTPIYQADGITTISHRVDSQLSVGTYEIRVRAHYSDGSQSFWSNAQQLTIGPPTVARLVAGTLSWAPVKGATHYELWIDYWGDHSAARKRIVHEKFLVDTDWQLPWTLPGGRYKAWVRAIRGEAGSLYQSKWSQAIEFRRP
ncbi:MAG: hypothetical protein R3C20_08955 [Planctomycetaceae bacterium]